MYKINLIPEVQEKKEKTRKYTLYAIIFSATIFGFVALLTVSMFIFSLTERAIINVVNNKIANLNSEISQYKELEESVLSLEKGLSEAKKILNGSNEWNRLFNHMESATPSDTRLKSISLKEDGSLELSVIATSIESLSKFIDSYKSHRSLVIRGISNPNETVKIKVDNSEYSTLAGPSGNFVFSIPVQPNTDHSINYYHLGNEETVLYSANKEVFSGNKTLQTSFVRLFNEVFTDSYIRTEDGEITFNVKLKLVKEALW